MNHFRVAYFLQGCYYHLMLIIIIWICDHCFAISGKAKLNSESHMPHKIVIANPPIGLFGPIEISPTAFPGNSHPLQPLSPMYPSFPGTYEPVLTGRCPINFSDISRILDKTASDCSAPLATLVGNVICCPQMTSLLHIFQGSYSKYSSMLALENRTADDCFSDIISILVSRGANNSVSSLCSAKPTNITGGTCPVKDVQAFEKIVNTSKLLDACSTVDPLKECCRPVCQPAIVEAAIQISLSVSSALDGSKIPGATTGIDVVGDCKGVVRAWLSMKLPSGVANTAFRILSSCKVNKVCPLAFSYPSSVIKACHDLPSSSRLCCSSLNTYISEIQKQMLITNRQAINCATLFGSMLQKGGVMTNIYELCDIDLKDFSLQAYGQEGCLLRSLPADIIFDNITGFSFTCDLSDNIAAPWPSSATLSSLSLCAPEMSLPALPVVRNAGFCGIHASYLEVLLLIFFYTLCSLAL